MPIATDAFLSSLLSIPSLPARQWYHTAAVTLSTLNLPEEVPLVYAYALKHCAIPGSDTQEYVTEERVWCASHRQVGRYDETTGKESALRILRRMREGLVKSGAVGGLPKAINSLLALSKAHQSYLLDFPDKPESMHYISSPHPTLRIHSLPPPLPTKSTEFVPKTTILHHILGRGQAFFDKLYGPVAERIFNSMSATSPDLGVLARWMYALVLSEEGVLDARETGFMMIACLVPQDVNPQLKGHLRGALNNGATASECNAIRQLSMTISEAKEGYTFKGEVAKL